MPSRIPIRWWIALVLFGSTTINYIDRQTLSVLAPHLKTEFHWNNSDFAVIVVAFRIAYSVFQLLSGRLLDVLGTRRGLTLAVIWYSVCSMLTAFSTGLRSFAVCRFLLGAGEAANWPGATKAVSEWFPMRQRGIAVAIFDSGSAVGGAIAPALVLWLYHSFQSWRPAFVITGLLGLAWVVVFRLIYEVPAKHPTVTEAERNEILAERHAEGIPMHSASWSALLQRPDTWGILLGRCLTDPVWFFITDWFAVYLVSKGFRLENTIIGFWVPFAAADLGNIAGGAFSGWLVRRGWNVINARKAVILVCGIGMALLVPAAFSNNFVTLITLFAVSTFSYAAWSTMALTLPTDLYASNAVATISGISGCGAGIGTIVSTLAIGWITDRYSFQPVLVGASIIPLIATAAVFFLVRNKPVHEHVLT